MRLIDADALEPDADYDDGDYWAVSMAQIQGAPTIEPEWKTGKWITIDYFAEGKLAYREWECSACGCVVEDEKPTWNFCPNCGADMRGEEE